LTPCRSGADAVLVPPVSRHLRASRGVLSRRYAPGMDESPVGDPRVRFDDLRTEPNRSFEMTGFRRAVVARRSDQVAPAIAEVESAARSGLWAAGFVSYEAAPGLDPSLRVRDA